MLPLEAAVVAPPHYGVWLTLGCNLIYATYVLELLPARRPFANERRRGASEGLVVRSYYSAISCPFCPCSAKPSPIRAFTTTAKCDAETMRGVGRTRSTAKSELYHPATASLSPSCHRKPVSIMHLLEAHPNRPGPVRRTLCQSFMRTGTRSGGNLYQYVSKTQGALRKGRLPWG